jgi:hypothetical protein
VQQPDWLQSLKLLAPHPPSCRWQLR